MEGLKAYTSFKEVLMDLPVDLIALSILIAIAPLIILYILKKPSVKSRLNSVAFYLFDSLAHLSKYLRRRGVDEKIKSNYTVIRGRKLPGLKAFLILGYYSFTGLIALLMIKKTLFFGLVMSQSMLPVLMPADLVLIQALTTQELEVGDIVMFNPPGQLQPYIHRIISIEGDQIRTKGDNVGMPDSWVLTRADIKGKAVMINGKPVKIPKMGLYFMPRTTYVPGSDPTYEFVRRTVQTVHNRGPVILVPVFVLILLGFIGKKQKYW
jgi:signal peptidase